MIRTHYEVLGLGRRCTAAEVRSAYRLLVRQFHPDLNPSSDEALARSQELNAAHEVLSDPARRRNYDRELEGDRPVRAKIQRSVSQDVHLRLEDFFRGTSLDVTVKDPGSDFGIESYQLLVPPMSAPGARFSIPRSESTGGGTVRVRLKARPHFRFKIRGSDLRCDLRINARRAAEGGRENIAGPTGNFIRLQIPARIARGEILRVPGEGMPKARGGRGDLLVKISYQPEVRIRRAH